MAVEEALRILCEEEPYRDFVTHVEEMPARAARPGRLRDPLPAAFQAYLDQRGFELHRHQTDVIDALREGRHVLVSTPTASGKTLAFNLPILERLAADREATVLYVYPTKALSQDQLKGLHALGQGLGVDLQPQVYDGDTPTGRKARIRAESRAILTNFYELHQVLAWSHQWERFWRHLAFVVIDEAHMYRGVFGSNVALLIRRLRRIVAASGQEPQFVLASATLTNAEEFGSRLTGVTPMVVDQDGSSRGEQAVVFYNPEAPGPLVASAHQETARVVSLLVREGAQTLCFAVSRQMAELITQWVRAGIGETTPDLSRLVASYRAGYLPAERRALETRLKTGELRAIVSTDALEVGIDIGSLDAVVLSGFPGTMISARQQMGRAGRSGQASLVVWVPFTDQMDQYLARHPGMFFGRPHEHAIVDLENPYILAGHLLCATAERPLAAREAERYFGPSALPTLRTLAAEGLVGETPRGFVFQSHPAPTQVVQLDAIGTRPGIRVMVDGERLLETMDWSRSLEDAHPGAVLLHQAETYVVKELDLDQHTATVKKQPVDYWTEPVDQTDIRILGERKTRAVGAAHLSWGEIAVTARITGYKIRKYDQVVGFEPLTLPPITYRTMGLWFKLPPAWTEELRHRGADLMGGLHAAEHAMIGLMPLHVLCDRWDLGGLSIPVHPDTGTATIFIHEGVEGGIGLTEKGFELVGDIVRTTWELVRDCPCEAGCPACVLSAKCSNDNVPIDKAVAVEVLNALRIS
jgi:DEAD/DEAH box helicase domain-containing protein